MSAFSSDLGLSVQDTTGNGTELDVATNLLNGDIRLSILWTQEILLSPDDADQVAQALQQAAEQGRRIAADTRRQFDERHSGSTEPKGCPAKIGLSGPGRLTPGLRSIRRPLHPRFGSAAGAPSPW